MEDDSQKDDPAGKEDKPEKSKSGTSGKMALVGANLLFMVFYFVLARSAGPQGFMPLSFIIVFHFILCVSVGIVRDSKFWILGGLLVLIIGFATCVSMG